MLSRAPKHALRKARYACRPSRTLGDIQASGSHRLLNSLAVLEQRDGQLNDASLSAVTAAQKLGGSITGFLAGSRIRNVAEEAAKVKGIDKIIMVENGSYDRVRRFSTSIFNPLLC